MATSDRELLHQLFDLLQGRTFVTGDEAAVKAMVRSMRNPPMTMRSRVVMQLTVSEYQLLSHTLTAVEQHLKGKHDPVDG